MTKATRSACEDKFQCFKSWTAPRANHEFYLSIYNPGDGRRYQICERRQDGTGGDTRNWPRWGHMKGKEFLYYVDGLIDGITYQPTMERSL